MNQALFDALLAMKRRDEEVRSKLLGEGRLYGGYDEEMQQVHIENAEKLAEIISQQGWPGISLVGIEGCRAAWFVAQHALCTPDKQRGFLDALEMAAARGDAPKRLVALLTDRIRYNEHKPQVYGTVLDWNDAGELSCDVEDRENLDTRRAEVGLSPFNEDLLQHRREVAAEGGTPPTDLAEYRQRKRDWAKRVGWI